MPKKNWGLKAARRKAASALEWYVLYVQCGRELEIRNKLQANGYPALVPREIIQERRKGRWHETVRILMPGYVFIHCRYSAELYQEIKKISGIINILPCPMYPVPLSQAETETLYLLAPTDDPLGISEAIKVGDKITIIAGPLKGLEGNIVKTNCRQKRASVRITLFHQEHIITMAVNLLSACGVDSSPAFAGSST